MQQARTQTWNTQMCAHMYTHTHTHTPAAPSNLFPHVLQSTGFVPFKQKLCGLEQGQTAYYWCKRNNNTNKDWRGGKSAYTRQK